MSASATHARELLSLVGSPTALVTGTFIAFANRTIAANQERVDRRRMWFGFGAGLGAMALSGAIAAVLGPLAFRSIFVFRGDVEAALVMFDLMAVSALGTVGYCGLTISRAIAELQRPDR